MKRILQSLMLLLATLPALAADYLFQPIPAAETPGTLPRVPAYSWRDIGATATHVAKHTGWRWRRTNGDWIDRDGALHGPASWAQFAANAVSGVAAEHRYSIDVTAAVQTAQRSNRWNAWHLRELTGQRVMAGVRHAAAPVVNVVYEDGTTEALDGVYSTGLTTSTVYTLSHSLTHSLPAVVEFERPSKPVQSATMLLTLTSHPSGRSTVATNLVDAPVNTNPIQQGIAESFGLYDDGILNHPRVIGAHRYVDGAPRERFFSDARLTISSPRDYSPHLWGWGPPNTELLPFKDNGKWIAAHNFELVDSKYQSDGFKPLAPGLGAIKIVMEPMPGITHGSIVGYSGTRAATGMIFMPPDEVGYLDRVFVRFYYMHAPADESFANRFQVYKQVGGPGAWTDMAGKTWITPSHDTYYGGVSGTSGGPLGWQMRGQISARNPDMLGSGGYTLGVHTFDFMGHNPPGHRYGDGKKPHMLDEQGGGVAIMQPGVWYQIEMEVDLNTITKQPPYYLADGAVRVWVDGRLALEMTEFVMRTGPRFTPEYHEHRLPPIGDVGIRNLWLNWFHGGTTQNSVRRVNYYTGLVWARDYIGTMNLSAAPTGTVEPCTCESVH